MNTISEHRKYHNEVLLPEWSKKFEPSHLVYDIGKSTTWDYKSSFKCSLKTIDRNSYIEPDICIDIEWKNNIYVPLADGILFNGVYEQCSDPIKLMKGIKAIIKPGGLILAGLASIGMTPYGDSDKWRLTRAGAREYMKDFKIIEFLTFPEYFYILGIYNR